MTRDCEQAIHNKDIQMLEKLKKRKRKVTQSHGSSGNRN